MICKKLILSLTKSDNILTYCIYLKYVYYNVDLKIIYWNNFVFEMMENKIILNAMKWACQREALFVLLSFSIERKSLKYHHSSMMKATKKKTKLQKRKVYSVGQGYKFTSTWLLQQQQQTWVFIFRLNCVRPTKLKMFD